MADKSKQYEYEPFGDEWVMEMKKFNKDQLVNLLRDVLIASEKKDVKIDELEFYLHTKK